MLPKGHEIAKPVVTVMGGTSRLVMVGIGHPQDLRPIQVLTWG